MRLSPNYRRTRRSSLPNRVPASAIRGTPLTSSGVSRRNLGTGTRDCELEKPLLALCIALPNLC